MSFWARTRSLVFKLLPWVITTGALYYVLNGIDLSVLIAHVHEVRFGWVALAVVATVTSYLCRSRRWQSLFPVHTLSFPNALRVLFLGFFMNNILPARAGELVRAHLGAKIAGQTRTLVLATIASERLVDGLVISFMFAVFALNMGDQELSHNLLLVAWLFAAVGVAVVITLACRSWLLSLAQRLHNRVQSTRSQYALDRLEIFLHGLSPLCSLQRAPTIVLWSIIIWGVELLVYYSVAQAFNAELSWARCVLFLVAVNFSSLIPAAPGGLGVIEAIATTVLMSVGVEREHALCMTLCQHMIQYAVVGIPGVIIMLNWKKTLAQVRAEAASENETPLGTGDNERDLQASELHLQSNSKKASTPARFHVE